MSAIGGPWLALIVAATLLLAACDSAPTRRYPATAHRPKPQNQTQTRPQPQHQPARPAAPDKDGPPEISEVPGGLESLPDAIPQFEPYSKYGNPPEYEVFGQNYSVLSSAAGYRETGLASWYGKKFHGKRTSSGEPYDMFKMTAAHKTLPLPSYARVTNLKSGKSVIVRINDRGPFHSARILDLSYAAATKLGTVGGVGMVEVEAIVPGKALPPAPSLLPATPPVERDRGFLQVAAYSDPINAIALREELLGDGISPIEIRAITLDRMELYRVMIGPFEQPELLKSTKLKLIAAGYDPDVIAN